MRLKSGNLMTPEGKLTMVLIVTALAAELILDLIRNYFI